jgi:hypothetical protein
MANSGKGSGEPRAFYQGKLKMQAEFGMLSASHKSVSEANAEFIKNLKDSIADRIDDIDKHFDNKVRAVNKRKTLTDRDKKHAVQSLEEARLGLKRSFIYSTFHMSKALKKVVQTKDESERAQGALKLYKLDGINLS